MKLSKERPRRRASGEDLLKALAALDRKETLPSPVQAISCDEERDDTGALPAGHPVTWGALWDGDGAPVYQEARISGVYLLTN